jgi:protease PrsW
MSDPASPPNSSSSPESLSFTLPKISINSRLLPWVLIGFGLFLALVLTILNLVVKGFQLQAVGPLGLIVGVMLATLPIPLYVGLALWLDRFEAEPPWMLLVAFLYGALVADILALILNSAGGAMATMMFGERAGDLLGGVVIAPFVEEATKAAFLVLLYFWRKDEFDNITDGIIYGTMVALGFAAMENVGYYGRQIAGGTGQVLYVFALRGLKGPFGHPLYTCMTGIGLGIARETDNPRLKIVAPIVGYLLAVFLHSLWNGIASTLPDWLDWAAYFVIWVPLFLGLLGVVYYSLRREAKIVCRYLQDEVTSGVLSQAEYDYLCAVSGRLQASLNALTKGGVRAWWLRGQFNQVASELAFLRWRVARGIVPEDERTKDLEAAYIRRLADLRARLAQPPPRRPLDEGSHRGTEDTERNV